MAEATCRSIIDLLRTAIARSGPNTHSALVVPDPSAPLTNALLLQHHHRLLLSHLPGLDPSINLVTGTRITETVGKVAVDLRETRIENKRVREKKENKGAVENFGANLAHLLNLFQVTDAKDLPPVWEALTRATKHQQLLVLHRAFNRAAEDMGLRAPTIATASLLNLVLAIGFRMESWYGLTTGLDTFVLGQHTSTVRKFLRGQADRHAMVASDAGAPSLADVEILAAPDGVNLPRNFLMACGKWLWTQLIVGTCFGVDHNAYNCLKEFREEMLTRETELEVYVPSDTSLRLQLLVLILRHAQIRWLNWITAQLGKTS